MAADDKAEVEILEHNPIDLAKYINYVSAPQAGAISTLLGTTQDSFDGNLGCALGGCIGNMYKFLIDELLKASVPIWNKELHANGEVW
ncbi:hypothetical protein FEM48_Zijuj04G0109100 [Ziziphus jujuba var. spinosa]|uniref:Uncharacterized protein n=1 Tax=Ziziphus jujuba var. spinosa TaxID=714518 RepID=A0A978VJH0_ZIZJJ|nr:hypothetical protein FEM48_Zijuj04G0109100 [Ziziphus jujuba var. spinosa]